MDKVDSLELFTLYINLNKSRQHYPRPKIIEKANHALEIAKKLKNELYTELFLGIIDTLKNIIDTSLDHFKRVTEIKPSSPTGWYEIGNVHFDLEEYGHAIEYYRKAIDLDSEFAIAWNSLGLSYVRQQNYEEATKSYEKAIQLDGQFIYPINNLGMLLGRTKEYVHAKILLEKAIELDEDNLFASPWNGLGNVYRALGDFDSAISSYEKAISIKPEEPMYWRNLARTYVKANKNNEAVELFLKVIEVAPSIDDYRTIAKLLTDKKEYERAIKFLEKALEIESVTKNEKNFLQSILKSNIAELDDLIKTAEVVNNKIKTEEEDPIAEVLKKTIKYGIEDKALKNKSLFLSFISQKIETSTSTYVNENDEYFPDKKIEPDYYLEVLRRWNSYTPIIADNYHISKGGGYFLKINNTGVVIDPGFNFIDNFKGADHLFNEIDVILISHAHNDHTADLESILTLLYKYNEEVKGLDDLHSDNTIRADIARTLDKPIDDDSIKAEEIEAEFMKSKRRKTLDLYITNSVYKKYSGLLDLFESSSYKLYVINTGTEFKLKNNCEVLAIDAKHHDIISDSGSVGFVIKHPDINSVFVYTGDTGWNDESIMTQYDKLGSLYKEKNIVLVAHLGGFKNYETNYFKETLKPGEKTYYTNHLGRIGLAKLLKILKPNVCFISEFGEEFKGSRIRIADIFSEAFPNTIVFPADIGLVYDIESKKIKAIYDVNLESYSLETKFLAPVNIEVCELRKDYSLHYFEKNKHFTESDLIQVLAEKFERSIK